MDRVEDSLLPLINLVFLLLMFFIVAGRLTDAALPELPGTQGEAQEQEQTPVADLIHKSNGQWLAAGLPVTVDNLLRHLPPSDEQTTLKIAAEKNLTMKELETVLQQLEQGGFQEVILLTEPTP